MHGVDVRLGRQSRRRQDLPPPTLITIHGFPQVRVFHNPNVGTAIEPRPIGGGAGDSPGREGDRRNAGEVKEYQRHERDEPEHNPRSSRMLVGIHGVKVVRTEPPMTLVLLFRAAPVTQQAFAAESQCARSPVPLSPSFYLVLIRRSCNRTNQSSARRAATSESAFPDATRQVLSSPIQP
jgi:hypothetical protein